MHPARINAALAELAPAAFKKRLRLTFLATIHLLDDAVRWHLSCPRSLFGRSHSPKCCLEALDAVWVIRPATASTPQHITSN